MHRSRLSALMIDCSDATMDCGVQFWSQALGLTVRHTEDAASPYVGLSGDSGILQLQLQRVNAESRFHLDIETDDVEAEVQRLEQLGARRLAHVSSWWVMQAPTGHHFCVVPAGQRTGVGTGECVVSRALPLRRAIRHGGKRVTCHVC